MLLCIPCWGIAPTNWWEEISLLWIPPSSSRTSARADTEMSTSFKCADGSSIPVQESVFIPEEYPDRFIVFVRDTHRDFEIGGTMTSLVCGDDAEGRSLALDDLLTDQLTGTWLRWRFFEIASAMCDKARESGTPLCLLFMDVDSFKSINDRCGHNVGDRALREVVRAVAASVREGDLLFRWGGDEFVVLLPHATIDEARALADRARAEVESRGSCVGSMLTVSIGVSSYESGEDVVEEWIGRADAAMYRAKRAGGNAVRS